MAFHPFGIVRKYQKVLMALATVFCMGVFILQFGRGDLIESLLGRGGQNKGEKLITLYGKDVYSSDVTRDRQGRQLANQLVQAAVGSAGGDANKNVMAYNPDKPNADDDQLKQLRGALTSRSQFIYQLLQVRPNRQIQEFLGSIAGQVEHDVATLDALQISIGSSDQPDKAKAAEQTRMIKDLRLLFKLQYLLASGPGALYFGGGVKDEDILDFEVWKHQAEKLGVVLTKADARRLIAHEAGDRGLPADPGGSWASDPLIKAFLDDPHTQMTEYQLVTAVVDEFRVEIAQNLLAGRASGVPALGAPNLTTDSFAPYDFWTYFRDNRTTLKVAFLPIPVPSFTDRVPGAPDSDELGKLFNQYRSKVPDPNSPTPGFKEPRRIRIEYLTARTDSDYYKELIDHLQYSRVRQCFYAGLPTNTAGGVVPALSLAGVLTGDLEGGGGALASDYGEAQADRRASAAVVGELVGRGSPGSAAWSAAPALLQASADNRQQEAERMTAAAFRLALAGTASGAPLGGLAASLLPPHALDGINTDLADRYYWEAQQKDELPQIIEADLEAFVEALPDVIKRGREEAEKKNAANQAAPAVDVEKYSYDRAEVFIQAEAKKHGWELNQNAGLDDVFALPTDPALQPLATAYQGGPPQGGPTAFANAVFTARDTGLYQPHLPPESDRERTKFMTSWVVQDERERELTYDDALQRGLLMDAWKLQQARKLALQKAEEISAGAKAAWSSFGPDSQGQQQELIKFLTEKQIADKLGETFEVAGVARLVNFLTPDVGVGGTSYQPYSLPADRLPNIADNRQDIYDPNNLVNRLLALDAPGKTLIFTDRPAKTFYVAVVEQRVVPQFRGSDKDKEFLIAYQDASLPPPASPMPSQTGPMWRQFFLPRREQEFGQTLIRQLREEAGPVNDQGRFILEKGKKEQEQPNEPGGQGPPPVDNPFS